MAYADKMPTSGGIGLIYNLLKRVKTPSSAVGGHTFDHQYEATHLTEADTVKIEGLEVDAPKALKNGQYRKAVTLYDRLESCSGRELFDHELYNRARAYRMLGEFEHAKQGFEQVISNDENSPYDGSATLQIADILYEQGETIEAMKKFIRINRRCPNVVKKHRGDETFPYLNKLVAKYSALSEKKTKNLLRIATTLHSQGDTERAMNKLGQAQKRFPKLVEKHLQRGTFPNLDELIVIYYTLKYA